MYGSLLIKDLMPVQYKHMLRGPSLKVDLHSGAIAEGVLTFIMNFAVLSIVIKGPRNPLLKTWLLSMTTVTLITFGSSFTGPSMNPANVSTVYHLSSFVFYSLSACLLELFVVYFRIFYNVVFVRHLCTTLS